VPSRRLVPVSLRLSSGRLLRHWNQWGVLDWVPAEFLTPLLFAAFSSGLVVALFAVHPRGSRFKTCERNRRMGAAMSALLVAMLTMCSYTHIERTNKVTSLDAAMSLHLHSGRLGRGASESALSFMSTLRQCQSNIQGSHSLG